MAVIAVPFGATSPWTEDESLLGIPPMTHQISREEPYAFVLEGKYNEPTRGQIWPRIG